MRAEGRISWLQRPPVHWLPLTQPGKGRSKWVRLLLRVPFFFSVVLKGAHKESPPIAHGPLRKTPAQNDTGISENRFCQQVWPLESLSKPGNKMVNPKPCKELPRRLHPFWLGLSLSEKYSCCWLRQRFQDVLKFLAS